MTEEDAKSSTFRLVGTVLPERYPVGLAETVRMSGEWRHGGFSIEFQIRANQLWAEMATAGAPDPLDVRNLCRDVAEAFVDAVGYEDGSALTVDIHGIVTPDGQFVVYDTRFDGLKADAAGFDAHRASFTAHAAVDPQVAEALADLRRGIAHPGGTAKFSFRAVEAIRQKYVHGGDSKAARRASWKELRDATGVSEGDLRWLSDQAVPARHGVGGYESGDDRKRSLQIARAVVEGHLRTLYAQALANERSEAEAPATQREISQLGAQRGMELRRTFEESADFVVPGGVTEVLVRLQGGYSGRLGSSLPEVTESVVSVTPGESIPIGVGGGGATPFGGRAPGGWAEIWWHDSADG